MVDNKYLEEWRSLAASGNFEEAQVVYYDRLFPSIISSFSSKYNNIFGDNVHLVSLLGFSPEPIILTASAIKPTKHLIVTSDNKSSSLSRIAQFLDNDYTVEALHSIDFDTIYKVIKETVISNNLDSIVIDITGGKKSMVCAASIFGRDFNCNIVYVDFTNYIKELRKPLPGSEFLDIVYDPKMNNPNLFQV